MSLTVHVEGLVPATDSPESERVKIYSMWQWINLKEHWPGMAAFHWITGGSAQCALLNLQARIRWPMVCSISGDVKSV